MKPLWLGFACALFAAPLVSHAENARASSSIQPENLEHFAEQPPHIQKLLKSSLALASKGLHYLYGSADPSLGGLDCSGAVHYLLQQAGFSNTPRQANLFYTWLADQHSLHLLSNDFEPATLASLAPGDLLFWTGTYAIHRDPPVTHVMIYLGKDRSTGLQWMMGASSSRSGGGVGVFPFQNGKLGSSGQFIAFGKLPAAH